MGRRRQHQRSYPIASGTRRECRTRNGEKSNAPSREDKINSRLTETGGQRKWRDKKETYVSNEKLGASVLEWDVTTIGGYGRGSLLNNSIYLFVSRMNGVGRDCGWLCRGGRGRGAWGRRLRESLPRREMKMSKRKREGKRTHKRGMNLHEEDRD